MSTFSENMNIGLGEVLNMLSSTITPENSGRYQTLLSRIPNSNSISPPYRIPTDLVQDEKTIDIYAELPGVEKSDIDIEFFNNRVTISAEKKRNYDIPELSEIKYGKWQISLTLNICVTKQETVIVNYKNGVIHIRINKFIEEQNRFQINTSNIGD